MKRIFILFVMMFCFLSCDSEIKTDYLVVDSYETERISEGNRVKYNCKVKCSSSGDVVTFSFRTDKQLYFVGDTLYLTKRYYENK